MALNGQYDAGRLERVSTTLLTFGDPAVTLHALTDVPDGRTRPTARISVQLPA